MKYQYNLNMVDSGKNVKSIKIGILGAPINNGNMGCVALTYSLLNILEEISNKLNAEFFYYIFEGVKNKKNTSSLCQKLKIEDKKIKSFNIYPVESLLGLCHRPHRALETFFALRECDVFIDLTQGDSFSDIYGNTVFTKNVNGKMLIEKRIKKPLILGPQTYGPYHNEKNLKKAKEAIEKANLVIARDGASAQYIKTFSNKEVHTTTDLAFKLPYNNKSVAEKGSKIKIGLNISGLLLKNKTESTPTEFQIKTDYDAYIETLLSWIADNDYDVWLVPHVIEDYQCGKIIAKKFSVKLMEMYTNPIDIKNKISELDIFIGARMHATIGAFSSGVATIPTAYSRKFNGLYESIGYPYIVDLLNSSTEENIVKTKMYIKNFLALQKAAESSMEKVNHLEEKTISLIEEQIAKIL